MYQVLRRQLAHNKILTNIAIAVFYHIEGTLHYKIIYYFLYCSDRKNTYYKCKMPSIWRCTLMAGMLKCEMSWNWWNTTLLRAEQRWKTSFGRLKCWSTLTFSLFSILFFTFSSLFYQIFSACSSAFSNIVVGIHLMFKLKS